MSQSKDKYCAPEAREEAVYSQGILVCGDHDGDINKQLSIQLGFQKTFLKTDVCV